MKRERPVRQASWLTLLSELCHRDGHALLLTARHLTGTFGTPSMTELVSLDVARLAPTYDARKRRHTRAARVRAGDGIASVQLAAVGGSVEQAAKTLVAYLRREADAA